MNSRFTLAPRSQEPAPDAGGRRKSSYLPWVGLSLLALMLALSATLAITQRQHVIQTERQNGALIARVLEEQATRQLDAAELILANVSVRARLNTAAQLALMGPALEEATRAAPILRSLSIVDARGKVLASSTLANRQTRIDLDLIGRPRNAGQSRLGAWLPGQDLAPAGVTRARAGDRPIERVRSGIGFIPVTQIAQSADGEPLYAVAALHPAFLADEFKSTVKGSGHSASLLSHQGMVIATTITGGVRAGDLVAMPPRLADQLPRNESGTFEGTGIDGQDAVGAFRATRKQPWVVVVERPASNIAAAWRDDMAWVMLATVILAVLIAAATAVAWRTLRNHELLEAALATAKQHLEENERSLRGLIEAAPAPMFVLDRLGHYAMVNHAFEDFLGIHRDAIVGAEMPLAIHLQQLAYHPVHDVAVWQGTGRSHYLDDLPGADGRLREALISKVAIQREDSRPRAVIGSITDVTELREAERHTREAMQIAQQANQSKNEFIANMSHGLRTPLQSVLGFAELGRWRSAEQKPLQDMFNDIHSAGKRMLVLVNDLLDMSKLESTVGTMHRDMADAATLTREVIGEFQTASTTRGVALRLFGLLERVPDRSEGNAWIDRLRLQQALRNVIDNALRFSPSGSAIDIELTRSADSHLSWAIRDQGPGIPDGERPYLFEAFFHGHRNRDDGGGFGLGLAITSKIMHAHGGSAWAENHPDGGAIFYLRLPSGLNADELDPTATDTSLA